jgi:hypothetical protein
MAGLGLDVGRRCAHLPRTSSYDNKYERLRTYFSLFLMLFVLFPSSLNLFWCFVLAVVQHRSLKPLR